MVQQRGDYTSASQTWLGLRRQMRSIHALMVRDMMMRYGRDHLGFVWVILEPMILTAGVLVIWSLIKPTYEHGVRVVALVLTGYMPLTLWRHLTNPAVMLFRRSVSMLYHRPITLFDIVFAKSLLEFAGTSCALIFVYFTLLVSGQIEPIKDMGVTVAAWLLMALFAFGVGTIFSVVTEYNEVSERFVQPFQYLLVPISGTFFLVDWLPHYAQELILLNPLVHCFEMFRAGFFGESLTTHYSSWYLGSWAFGLTVIGLSGVQLVRSRLKIV
jgi:capsular polysaccharide transport system permease protein